MRDEDVVRHGWPSITPHLNRQMHGPRPRCVCRELANTTSYVWDCPAHGAVYSNEERVQKLKVGPR